MLIKQVKHNACGYRLFSHFKARIMLIKGLYNPLNNIVKERLIFSVLLKSIYH